MISARSHGCATGSSSKRSFVIGSSAESAEKFKVLQRINRWQFHGPEQDAPEESKHGCVWQEVGRGTELGF
jgi:hypothetical protein